MECTWRSAVVAAMLLATVAMETAGYPKPLDTSDDPRVADLVARFWQWRLRESPEYGTKIGLHNNDHLVEEFTEEAFIRQKSKAESYLTETMRLLDRGRVSRAVRTDLLILQHNLLAFCEGYEFRSYGMYNPVGQVRNWLQQMSFMPKETEHDYRNILARYRALPRQIADQIELMRKSIKLGHTYHNSTMEAISDAAEVRREAEAKPDESSFYILPFRAIPFTMAPEKRMELMRLGFVAVRDHVLPAWGELYKFLSTEYLAHTRPGIGVSSMPGGERFYSAALKWHTTTDLTPMEVHQMGLDEVERLSGLMADLVRRMGYNGTTRDYIAILKADSTNFYRTEKAMLKQYQVIMNKVHRRLPRVLKHIPTTNVTVRGFSSPSAALGYYLDPPLDGSRPGYFYANVHQPETKAKFEMLPLTLHEAEPGHHTQCAYAIDMDLPAFRTAIEFRKFYAIPFNWPFMTASIEGWALYAETLHDEMKLHNGEPLTLLGLYSSEIFRATRLVVDTGIHVLGWTEQQGKDYIANYTTFASNLIDAEVKRYIASPAQACAYKVGELMFKKLRTEAEDALGARFDLREYHHQLLSLGPTPLNVVADVIKLWVKDEKEKMMMETGSGELHIVAMETDVMVIPMGEEITVYQEPDSAVIEFTEIDLMMNESKFWMSRMSVDHTLSYDIVSDRDTLASTAGYTGSLEGHTSSHEGHGNSDMVTEDFVPDADLDLPGASATEFVVTSRSGVKIDWISPAVGVYDVTSDTPTTSVHATHSPAGGSLPLDPEQDSDDGSDILPGLYTTKRTVELPVIPTQSAVPEQNKTLDTGTTTGEPTPDPAATDFTDADSQSELGREGTEPRLHPTGASITHITSKPSTDTRQTHNASSNHVIGNPDTTDNVSYSVANERAGNETNVTSSDDVSQASSGSAQIAGIIITDKNDKRKVSPTSGDGSTNRAPDTPVVVASGNTPPEITLSQTLFGLVMILASLHLTTHCTCL